jgi:cob(I)alamin adenosyltransferase
MSNRQEKIKRNQEEAAHFVSARREVQLAIFESNFKVGLQMIEDNRDKLSEEELETLEKQIKEIELVLEKLRSEII